MFFLEKTIDRMVEHVLYMPGPSCNRDGRCLYRAPDDNQCLIGRFIPDEMYDETWEEVPWGPYGDDVGWPLILGSSLVKALEVGLKREGLMPADESLTRDDLNVLRALQKCHDDPVVDVNEKWVDPSIDPNQWRFAVIQRLNGVRYSAEFLYKRSGE